MKRLAAALLLLAALAIPAPGAPDVDLTAMGRTMLFAVVRDIKNNPESYLGRRVKMAGQFAIIQGVDAQGQPDPDKIFYNCVIPLAQNSLEFGVAGELFSRRFPRSRSAHHRGRRLREIRGQRHDLLPRRPVRHRLLTPPFNGTARRRASAQMLRRSQESIDSPMTHAMTEKGAERQVSQRLFHNAGGTTLPLFSLFSLRACRKKRRLFSKPWPSLPHFFGNQRHLTRT